MVEEDNNQTLAFFLRYKKCSILSRSGGTNIYKVKDTETNKFYTLKKVHNDEDFEEDLLREIAFLQYQQHPNIIQLKELVSYKSSVYMLFEWMDCDLRSYILNCGTGLPTLLLKSYLYQILRGVAYMHSVGWIHRDLKTSSLLLNRNGELKIASLGSCRTYHSSPELTPIVVCLWYRAPEVLYGKSYTTAIDMWSVGCILAEMSTGNPLFAGDSEIDQILKQFRVLGRPTCDLLPSSDQDPFGKNSQHDNDQIVPSIPLLFYCNRSSSLREYVPLLDDLGFDLLSKLLCYDPSQRITAIEALEHPFFDSFKRSQPISVFKNIFKQNY